MSATSVAEKWVDEVAALTTPAEVVWCDGSKAEYDRLVGQMLGRRHPRAPQPADLSRTAISIAAIPSDVARTEQLTFICSREQDDAGPTNNWMDPRGGEGADRRPVPRAACAAGRCTSSPT